MKPLLAAAAIVTALALADAAEAPKPVTAPYPPPRGYVCFRAPGPMKIDGKLTEAEWGKIPWSEPFRDIEGNKRPDPPLKTRMKMCWDDHGLYIAAEIEEPHVWGTLTKHDSVIFHDNDFEVFIDPDGDGHVYAEMEMNVLNTTWDLLLTKPYKDGGFAIHAWEAVGLKTAVHVKGTLNDPRDRDEGWTLEIFWPWEGLKELGKDIAPPQHGAQWRVNYSRVEWDHEIVDGKYRKVPKRPEHNWVWSPQGVIDMHRPERWGVVEFSTAAPAAKPAPRDPAQPARDFLYGVYYAQLEFIAKHRRHAKSLEELGVSLPADARELSDARLETTATKYEVSVVQTVQGKARRRWVDSASRFYGE